MEQAAEELLSELIINLEWKLLGFYARLIEYAHKTEYLRLNGFNTNRLLIIVAVMGKG